MSSITSPPPHRSRERIQSIDYLPALFLVLAIWFLPTGSESGALNSLSIVFVSIVLEAIPFMFVGSLIGGPIVNPIVAASTALAYAFDWRVVVLRLALGYGIAVCIGILMGRFFSKMTAIKPGMNIVSSSCGCIHHHIEQIRIGRGCINPGDFPIHTDRNELVACGCGGKPTTSTDGWIDKVGCACRHAVDDFLAVGHYLVIGAFIAALAQTYIERSSFLKVAEVPFLSVALMMVLAILLNLCSEADAFIAASFRGFMPLSAQMAFMLIGPMFDLKLLLMYQSVFQRRAIIVLASLILVAVLGISVGIEWINGMVS